MPQDSQTLELKCHGMTHQSLNSSYSILNLPQKIFSHLHDYDFSCFQGQVFKNV